MTIFETILTVLVSIFGGLNIFQLIFWRTQKQKLKAEADDATTEAKQKSIDLQQDQFEFLQKKLSECLKDYYDLADKLQDDTRKYLETIHAKTEEVADLKSQIVYFKGLRCYRCNCDMRIKHNPKDQEPSQSQTDPNNNQSEDPDENTD